MVYFYIYQSFYFNLEYNYILCDLFTLMFNNIMTFKHKGLQSAMESLQKEEKNVGVFMSMSDYKVS